MPKSLSSSETDKISGVAGKDSNLKPDSKAPGWVWLR